MPTQGPVLPPSWGRSMVSAVQVGAHDSLRGTQLRSWTCSNPGGCGTLGLSIQALDSRPHSLTPYAPPCIPTSLQGCYTFVARMGATKT